MEARLQRRNPSSNERDLAVVSFRTSGCLKIPEIDKEQRSESRGTKKQEQNPKEEGRQGYMALESFVSMPMSPPLMPISPVDYGAIAMSSDEMSIFNATDSMEGILQDDHSASPFEGLCHGHGHGGFSAAAGAFNAPTMHPNLVSTLKNVISQQNLDDDLHFLHTPHHGFEDAGLASDDGFLNYQTEAGFQPPAEQQNNNNDDNKKKQAQQKTRRSPKLGGDEEDREDRQIATVSVDLIQNRRPFKCAYGGCDKTFKNPQTLKMHHKTHYTDDAAEKRLGEQFLNNNTVGNCRAGHNKKIPCRCPVCRRTFVGLYELRRHFGRKHSEGEKMYGCRKCGKRFYIEVDLRDHEKLCGEPIECKCGMKFAFKCNLVAHKKTHPECQDSSHSPPPPLLPNEDSCSSSSSSSYRQIHPHPTSLPVASVASFSEDTSSAPASSSSPSSSSSAAASSMALMVSCGVKLEDISGFPRAITPSALLGQEPRN